MCLSSRRRWFRRGCVLPGRRRAARRRYQAARAGITLPTDPAPQQEAGDREGELQVRLTAQRILSARLRDDRPADQRSTLPAAPPFWEGMRLDLAGDTLIDFDLAGGHVADAVFDKATFHGDVRFDGATFTEHARFVGATFTKTPRLGGAVVVDPAAAHVWPDGWWLEVTPEGLGRLIREEADGAPAGDAWPERRAGGGPWLYTGQCGDSVRSRSGVTPDQRLRTGSLADSVPWIIWRQIAETRFHRAAQRAS
ncbi:MULTISPECIES: pentapeptide repeat-containing protein [Streptosporangium]|nr:pentapeptide repeat-containing protein [Streptosporangium brasiliense]